MKIDKATMAQLKKDIDRIGKESSEATSLKRKLKPLMPHLIAAKKRGGTYKAMEAALLKRGVKASAATLGTYVRKAMAILEDTEESPSESKSVSLPKIEAVPPEGVPDEVVDPESSSVWKMMTDDEIEAMHRATSSSALEREAHEKE